ncbi:MAG TPA: type II secretion system protein GspM [Rhodopila sp.]|jgi:general secretion pathway protein M
MTADSWLSGRRGQALAVGIGLLGIIVIWFGIIDPAWSWFDDRAALLAQRQELLVRMQGLAASLPTLRASVGKRGEGADSATMMLPGDSDAVAAADLQERVQKMAADAGANLTAVETLPPAPAAAGHWHRVSLRITVTASWPVLMALIGSVEQSPTRILINDVHFRSPILAIRPTVVPIQASMELYGFRAAGAGT